MSPFDKLRGSILPKTFSTPDSAKRHPLTVRTTEAIRKQLEDAATQSGRSLAQELERRIGRSIELDDLWAPQNSSIVVYAVLSALRGVEVSRGEMWTQSSATKAACKAAMIGVIDAIMPDEPGTADATDQGQEIAAAKFHPILADLVDEHHEPLSKDELKAKMVKAAAARKRS